MADGVGQQLGNYRLIRLLGQGGFATVYLAEHVYLETSAAIKVLQVRLTDDALDTFLAEARTVARLSHPHIIRVLEFGMEQSTPFLVMNYAPYGSLRQRHPAGSLLPSAQILSYVQQVTSALQYAHDRLIIHRDVKPENMLLGEAFAVMLGDFGLATTVQNQSHSRNDLPVHHTQRIAGTTTYMAPEQFDGVPSPASDQYALAVAVYEWFCGTPPFRGTIMGVALQHMQAPPPPLREHRPSLSPSIEQIVLHALAKDPRARFLRVQDFAHALEEACLSWPASSDDGQGMAPLVLPPVMPAPSGSQFSEHGPGAHLHSFASTTVADHAVAPGPRPLSAPMDQRTQYPPHLRHTGAFPAPPPSPRSLSRRKMILGLAGVTGGLVGLGHLDLFVRSSDQVLWRRRYDGTWHTWESLGGSLQFDPVAISWDGQRIDLFMRGEDDTLQHRFYDGSWHDWGSLGGSLLASPAVTSWGPNRLDVLVRGADNALWHIAWDTFTWSGWESLGGGFTADPTATSWGNNRIDLLARDPSKTLQHMWFDGSWHPWALLP